MVFENQRKLPSFLAKKDDESISKCQKCLETGHWTFECKNKRVYLDRKTKCDELKEIAKRREEPVYTEQADNDSSSGSDSDDSSSSSSSASEDSSSSSASESGESSGSNSSDSSDSSSGSNHKVPKKKAKLSVNKE